MDPKNSWFFFALLLSCWKEKPQDSRYDMSGFICYQWDGGSLLKRIIIGK